MQFVFDLQRQGTCLPSLRDGGVNYLWTVLTMEFGSGFMDSQVVLVVKNLPANTGDARDAGLIPGFGRSPGG